MAKWQQVRIYRYGLGRQRALPAVFTVFLLVRTKFAHINKLTRHDCTS